MEIRHLRYFQAVAEAGHVTRAAERLGIQQPPLSQQIRALETELGMPLFRRHPKGVTLTDAGRLLQVEAGRLLGDFDALRQRMRLLAEGKRGVLAIGFTSSAAAHAFTPRALRESRARYPDIVLQMSEDHAAALTEALAAGRLHCGLLRVPVARPAELAFETLLHETPMVAMPMDHALARPGGPATVPIEALDGEPLILVRRPGAPGLYGNLLALCEARGVRPVIVAEVDRMLSNLNLVAAGAGLSIVPASMQGTHAHAVIYRPLEAAAGLDVPLTLAYRRAGELGPTATFIALLRELAAGAGAGT